MKRRARQTRRGRASSRRRRRSSIPSQKAQAPTPPRDRKAAGIAVAAFAAAAIAIWHFLPLFEPIRKIAKGRLDFYSSTLLPIALFHAGAMLLIWIAGRRRAWAIALFATASGVVVIALGGFTALWTALALASYGVIAAHVGASISRVALNPRDRRWPVELGFGILATSVVASLLGSIAGFRGWILAIVLVMLATPAMRRSLPRLRRLLRLRRNPLEARWSLADVIAFEGASILAMFVWIYASTPESRSDGLRLYLPFIKRLAHDHRFPTVPFPWSVVIPEAGPAYSATLFALFGNHVLRYAMALCLLVLVGIVGHIGRGRPGRAVAWSIGISVASIPLVLGTSSSVMNEAFVSLSVVLFAWVAARSPRVDRIGVAVILGAIGGVAVAAKYTTLAFLAPLGLAVVARAARVGRRKVIPLVFGAIIGALATFYPWMANASRLVGNPFFPFLSRWIPTRVYPHGLGKANLDVFRIPPGWVSWLRAPLDMTFSTSHYLESFAGSLGLAFLAVLLVSLVLLGSRHRSIVALWVIGALTGTALLWTQTAYVRYWLPAVWLLALGAASGLTRTIRSAALGAATTALAVALMLLQIPVATSEAWQLPDGFPWDEYAGIVSDDQFMARLNGGAPLLEFSRRVDGWPTVLETALDGCASIDGNCIEMAFWHLDALFDVHTPEKALEVVRRTGAEYWAINSQSDEAGFFRSFGLAERLLRPDTLVYSSKQVDVYRIRVPLRPPPGN